MAVAPPIVIGLYMLPWHSYIRDVLLGVREAAAGRGWELYLPWVGTGNWPEPKDLGVAGIIAGFDLLNATQLRQLEDVPHVTVGSSLKRVDRIDVTWDHAAIGRMAAEHLLDQGHRNLATWFAPHRDYQRARAAGFCRQAREAGCRVTVVHDPTSEAESERITLFDKLPEPCGLFCPSDRLGHDVLHLARRIGVVVPDRLALVSTGNEEDYCELTAPPMSSVALPGTRAGRTAVELLAERMEQSGGRRDVSIALPPRFVAARRSSDPLRLGDREVMRALDLIRRLAPTGLTAEDVHRQSSLSRRGLESRFVKAVGRPIGKQIQRVRLTLARDLLATTNLPVAEVARRCGFKTAQGFSNAFSQSHGQSPGVYRAER
ncbi:MAG: substrate-binding domain-containing protein [Planctomycetota bacterium]